MFSSKAAEYIFSSEENETVEQHKVKKMER